MGARRPGPAAPAGTRGWTLELEVEHGHAAAAAAVLFDGAGPVGAAESMVQGKEEEKREEETREYESRGWPHSNGRESRDQASGVNALSLDVILKLVLQKLIKNEVGLGRSKDVLGLRVSLSAGICGCLNDTRRPSPRRFAYAKDTARPARARLAPLLRARCT